MPDYPINSMTETDLYKYSMGQVALHWFPKTTCRVEFKCRSDVKIGYLKPRIDECLDRLCSLRYSRAELEYLRGIYWLAPDYVDYLERFYMKRDQIHTEVDGAGQLVMWAEGPWRDVIYFEIPCLAIVQDLYMRSVSERDGLSLSGLYAEGDRRLTEKIAKLKECWKKHPFTLADFGIRRRFNAEWHDHVVGRMTAECPEFFVGSSNVALAAKYRIKPIGTFAHEFFQVLQAENIRLSEVQKTALDIWAKEYRGDLGIALSDIFGFRAFLRDFDRYFAKLFDGCRHDSGDPFKWGHMLISHFESLGIDPRTKTGCWSDSLDPDLICRIAEEFSGKIKVSFGVGTNLCNDLGVKPLSIVMKITEANGQPVAKLSDAPGKQMCRDLRYVEYLKQVYKYRSIDDE